MFSFFKKKEVLPPVAVYTDKVQMYRQLMAGLSDGRRSLVVCFFEKTANELKELLNAAQISSAKIVLAPVSHKDMNGAEQVLMAEIYPTATFYTQTISSLTTAGRPILKVFSSLDNPFFSHFGGDKLKTLTARLGMQNDEAIVHPMIDRAIQNAQTKTESRLASERKATSIEEWFSLNQLPSR